MKRSRLCKGCNNGSTLTKVIKGSLCKIPSSIKSKASLEEVKSMVENQAIRPFIDKTYPLEDIQKAHAYVDTGRKRGNISIII